MALDGFPPSEARAASAIPAASGVPIPPTPCTIDRAGLGSLITRLREGGYRTLGPTVADGAIVLGEIDSIADLPQGWHDTQGPGTYRLTSGEDGELFGWAVGPQSAKRELWPPRSVVWRAAGGGGDPAPIGASEGPKAPIALVGVRPCEVAAIGILDGVLGRSPVPDPDFVAARRDLFVCTVECGRPSASCFCESMGSGPSAESGFDLALTEIRDVDGERFLVRAGSERGAAVLAGIRTLPAEERDLKAREAVVAGARAGLVRRVDTAGLPRLLERTLENPRWSEVAARCLSCGNCTQVCPTCFCVSIEDVTDVTTGIERHRRWASCFEVGHSYLHGGAVRPSTRARYRQWLTHKLGTWFEQFGTSGCVGCGRCLTWCPVGIDLTEEVAALRASDVGNPVPAGERGV